jgi:hypothetical protein
MILGMTTATFTLVYVIFVALGIYAVKRFKLAPVDA